MNKTDKIYIAGHRGMVGSAIHRHLLGLGFEQFALRTSSELDLRKQAAVNAFFQKEKPDYVFLAAAKVGGILANDTFRAEFLYDNLLIAANVIEAAKNSGVQKLLFLGSSCIYPKHAPQPLKEDYLLSGYLEPTNEPYAIAKIAGIKLCETYRAQYGCNFISVLPTNLYGPNDNYHPENSHVLPALLRKIHEAKLQEAPSVAIWGTGTPRREFMHVDDLADACRFLMQQYEQAQPINIGVGSDISILEVAQLIQQVVGYSGDIRHDLSKPDGTPRKLLDISQLQTLGWTAKIDLEQGIRQTYQSFLKENPL